MPKLSEKRIADDAAEKNRNMADAPSVRYKNQTDEYNAAYRKWRSEKRMSMGYVRADNPNELTYKDGVGFISDDDAAFERRSMTFVTSVVMGAMVLYYILEMFSLHVLPLLMSAVGMNIGMDYSSGHLYGGGWEIIFVTLFMETVKRLVPFLIMKKYLNMPLSIILPMKAEDRDILAFSVPAAMLSFPFILAVSAASNMVLKGIGITPSEYLVQTVETPLQKTVMLMITVIAVPVLSELLLRGMVIHSMRQFGDRYAVLMSALISALCVHTISQFCFSFVSAVLIGHFSLRSGSMVSAVAMRITYRACTTATWYGEIAFDGGQYEIFMGILLLVCITVGLVGAFIYITKSGRSPEIGTRENGLSAKEKFICTVTCPSALVWLSAAAAMTIMSININIGR